MANALTKFADNGTASVISYNVPEPTIYNGRTVSKLYSRGAGVPGSPAPQESDPDYPVTSMMLPPAAAAPIVAELTLDMVTRAMMEGFGDRTLFPNLGVPPGRIRYVVYDATKPNQYYQRYYPAVIYYGMTPPRYYVGYTGMVTEYDTTPVFSGESGLHVLYFDQGASFYGFLAPADWANQWLSDPLRTLTPATVLANLRAGLQLRIFVDATNRYDYRFEAPKRSATVAIIEKYRLSTFLGNYGAGRTLQTFSLLPGEKTKISIKTYQRSTTTAKAASSVLDSYTKESAQEFEDTVGQERSNRSEQKDSQEWHVEAEVEQNWGVVEAKAKAGYSGGTTSARESTARNMSNATQKHAAKATSKRDINITQSSETKVEEGSENSSVRELQNINVGSTLNFVFRQMNQQFYTLFHLVDAQLAYLDSSTGIRRFGVGELEELLDLAFGASPSQGINGPSTDPTKWATARILMRNRILSELLNVVDHTGTTVPFIEEKSFDGVLFGTDNEPFTTKYWRSRSDMTSVFKDLPNNFSVEVPGIILSATANVMRTDAVIVDSVLGLGQGLDHYSQELQNSTVRLQKAQNDLGEAQRKRLELAQQLLEQRDSERGKLYGKLFPPAPTPAAKDEAAT
jgi:hypothetical protein